MGSLSALFLGIIDNSMINSSSPEILVGKNSSTSFFPEVYCLITCTLLLMCQYLVSTPLGLRYFH